MKKIIVVVLLVAWIVSLVVVAALERLRHSPQSIAMRTQLQEWNEILDAGRRPAADASGARCLDAACGHHRMLAIWAALDATARRWAGTNGPGAIEALTDPSTERSAQLLPVFKGALYGQNLSYQDYLSLRAGISARLPQAGSNRFVQAFQFSVRDQQAERFPGRPELIAGRYSLTNASCQADLLVYLQSGRHRSLPEERWLALLGQAFISTHRPAD